MDPVCTLTPSCSIQGKQSTIPGSNKPISTFLGVPYAKPPVGSLRFMPPQQVALWEGRRDATEYGAICPQNIEMAAKTHFPYPMPEKISEDCLFLNVWSPDTKGKLPVMVWIHGGSFLQGFSDFYNGSVLATYHDVVVVSINYRLGPFGFLCSGDGVLKGNMGLLDQLEAFRFLKRYIAKFGGDPDNITLFGESAGAISIAFHLLSPLALGLFRRGICESGASTHPGCLWTQQQAAKYVNKRLSKDGKTLTGQAIISLLANKSGEEVSSTLGEGFNPVLDGEYLPDLPQNLLTAKQFHNADMIVGFNSHEGAQFLFAFTGGKLIETKAQAEEILNIVVKVRFFRGNPNGDDIVAAISGFYLSSVGDNDYEGITAAMVDMYGDLLFAASSLEMADVLSGSMPVQLYHFNHRPPFSMYPDFVRADHGNDITYVWGEPFLGRFPDLWTDEDKSISRQMMRLWTNFAATGTAHSSDLPSWPQYRSASRECLVIQGSAQVSPAPRQRAAQFWNKAVHRLATQTKSKY